MAASIRLVLGASKTWLSHHNVDLVIHIVPFVSQTRQSTEAYPVLAAVYGAVLKEWRTLVLLLAAGPHRESGHRKVRDCETGHANSHSCN